MQVDAQSVVIDSNGIRIVSAGVLHAAAGTIVGLVGPNGSGKQKVLIARALAQQPKVLILDEPTNHLDIAAQLDLLELVRSLGITVVTAVHDLNLASSYCDQIFVLDAGRVVASGSPEKVFVPDLLLQVFRVRAHCGTHPLTGRPLLAFAPTTKETR